MLDFEVNQGKQIIGILTDVPARVQMGPGEAVVLRLSQTILEGTKPDFDVFSSFSLLDDALSDRNIRTVGTFMKNRIPRSVTILNQKNLKKLVSECLSLLSVVIQQEDELG